MFNPTLLLQLCKFIEKVVRNIIDSFTFKKLKYFKRYVDIKMHLTIFDRKFNLFL